MRLNEVVVHLCVNRFPASRPGRRVIRGDTGGPSRRSCDRQPPLPLPLSGPDPLSLLTTGQIKGPF